MMMKDSLISVIVPVYNAEEFLEQCLESIVTQTYKDIEILLIDDGSTDHSREICKSYKEKDCRIKYYQKKNEGSSAARNFGLKLCSGNYVAFIDADDFITENFLESLFDNMKKHNAAISACNFKEIRKQGESISCRLDSQMIVYDEQLNFCQYAPAFIYVWGKLFQKDLLEGIFFDEKISVGEDSLFSVYAAKKSGRIYFDSNSFYMYRIRQNSVSHQKDISKQKTGLMAWELISLLQPKGSIAYWSARLYYLKGFRQFVNLDGQGALLFSVEFKKYFKSLFIVKDRYKEKILLLLLACFPSFYLKVYMKFKSSTENENSCNDG